MRNIFGWIALVVSSAAVTVVSQLITDYAVKADVAEYIEQQKRSMLEENNDD